MTVLVSRMLMVMNVGVGVIVIVIVGMHASVVLLASRPSASGQPGRDQGRAYFAARHAFDIDFANFTAPAFQAHT